MNERWEQDIPHDSRSERLIRAMAKIDFEQCDDSLQINIGGDGDNGETMMYLLDMHFAEIDDAHRRANHCSTCICEETV